jgi:hypothetical protein
VVESGHVLGGRVERNFGDPRPVFKHFIGQQPRLGRQGQQGSLGWIADQGAILDPGIDAQGRRQQDMTQCWRAGGDAFEAAFTAVTLAADQVTLALGVDGAGGHLIECQRAGFVGADYRRAAESLDCGQLLDDGVTLGHPVHAQGQRHRHHRRQAFGNGGHGQGDGGHRGLDQFIPAHQAHEEHQADHDGGDDRQPLAQAIELNLQGGFAFCGLGQQTGQAPHFGVHPGSGYHGFEAAPGDHGVHEHHVVAFCQHRRFRHHIRQLRHGMGFAGQCRFRDLGTVRAQHPGIGRNAVAGFEQQNVAGHQISRLDLLHLTIATHPGAGRQHVFQCR